MAFINPSEMPNIPTYRVMDSDGVLVDKSRKSIDVPKEEILSWYKNMLTGWWKTRLMLLLRSDATSECHGRDNVRGATTGSVELLHGMRCNP